MIGIKSAHTQTCAALGLLLTHISITAFLGKTLNSEKSYQDHNFMYFAGESGNFNRHTLSLAGAKDVPCT